LPPPADPSKRQEPPKSTSNRPCYASPTGPRRARRASPGERNDSCFRPSASAMQIHIWARVGQGVQRTPASPVDRPAAQSPAAAAGRAGNRRWPQMASGRPTLPRSGSVCCPARRRDTPGDGLRQRRRRRSGRLRRSTSDETLGFHVVQRRPTRRREANGTLLHQQCVERSWWKIVPASRIGTQPSQNNSSEASRRRAMLDVNLLVATSQFHSYLDSTRAGEIGQLHQPQIQRARRRLFAVAAPAVGSRF
jgi:hypothetical protein